ncbi:Rieske (2Fe-2S) protein [Hoyosella altamirensis]|uniref:Nitrite reductase/ring-hydroxylating ferredoxin subunit n=1 Tax=Hoyosella altamirensis TaxID=616997 RepID=A0A839RJU8_9ACTN|nr:Rieske (2Fe-2S) protein [Hoyosella altamirensis]MBB3036454.1 nitrite reductase/ring-hydroxylating ferredoxin subunit [Hoyosella altamirensis]
MSRIGPEEELPPGTVTQAGSWAVGNNGEYFAVSHTCRHFGANLAQGSIDADGCLVCPWHGAKYDVKSGRMVLGPQGIFAKIPGVGLAFKTLTRIFPLQRGRVVVKNGDVWVE